MSRTPDALRARAGIRAGDRATLARAITLIESKRADHCTHAHRLVQELLPLTGKAVRLGITGAPGAGKSTLIDALGSISPARPQGRGAGGRPVVSRSGGSILGDKTRMARLAVDPNAFIRPSPASGTLGGVAAKTRETMLLCEAAGFDVIIVETVGVGQSETAVADMTDFFLLLMVAGAGDELQGIKKGVVELADMIAVNKADGDNVQRAQGAAAAEFASALNILAPRSPNWQPPVMTCSALTGDGIAGLWANVLAHRDKMSAIGEFAARRREQQVKWMWTLLEERLTARLRGDPAVRAKLRQTEAAVAAGKLAPTLAVEQIARVARPVMTTILITGFGPFPGAPVNPTTPLVRHLARLRRPALARRANRRPRVRDELRRSRPRAAGADRSSIVPMHC